MGKHSKKEDEDNEPKVYVAEGVTNIIEGHVDGTVVQAHTLNGEVNFWS